MVATAHPGKFPEVVEPLVGRAVPLPPALADQLRRPFEREEIDADSAGLRERMLLA